MSETNLVIVRSRIEKAAVTGVMGLAEQVEFFSSVDQLLKEHAQKKLAGEKLSAEQAFSRLYSTDTSFRGVVQKSRELQQELADSSS